MGHRTSCFFTFIMAIGLVILGLQPASAQEDEFTLEEIVVTAEKRSENVQDSALAISVITGSDASLRARSSLEEVLRSVPGLQMTALAAGGQFYIRGIGSNMDTTLGDPGVALNVDGIYQQQSVFNLQTMFDVSRVEVLRGPQGTLYGRNANAGSINLITNQPDTEKFSASGTLTVGNYSLQRSEAMLNVPASSKFAFRLATVTEKRDGYLSNGMNAADTKAGRFKILFKPNEDMSLTGTFEYRHEDGSPMGAVESPITSHDDPWTGYMRKGFFETDAQSYNIDFNWDIDWSILSVLSSYATNTRYENRKEDQAQLTGEDSYSTEIRLNSPNESEIIWVAGLYLYSGENDYLDAEAILTSGDEETVVSGDQTETLTRPNLSYAAFAQMTYPISNKVRLTGGGRYTRDDKSVEYKITNAETGYDSGVITQDDINDSATFKGGMEFDIAENNMVYATVANGYKAGGLAMSNPPYDYDSETLLSYAVGSKNRFFENRLQVNAEAFYYDFDNYQIQYPYEDPLTSSILMLITNASSATNYGLEIETSYLLTGNDRLDTTLSYLNAEFGEFVYDDAWSGTQNYSNTVMPNSPEWSGSINYEHWWDLSNGGRISFEGNMKITQEYYVTFEKYRTDALQPSFTKSDIFLAYTSPDNAWIIRVYCKNIEDEPVRIFRSPSGTGLAEPRTYGAVFSARF